MIKLIASDMDGTLLDDDSRVPEETFELIHRLAEKGAVSYTHLTLPTIRLV